MRCPENVTIVADGEHMNVSWPDPIFYDAQGSDIKVTSTFGTNTTTLSWGEHRVEYTATNTYNNRTTFCVFHIDVFRKSYRLHGKCMHVSIIVKQNCITPIYNTANMTNVVINFFHLLQFLATVFFAFLYYHLSNVLFHKFTFPMVTY